jgi:hypothetical protein
MDNSLVGNLHLSSTNDSFVPPKDSCLVNNIPPEILSLIFEIGARSFEDEDFDEEEGADEVDSVTGGTPDKIRDGDDVSESASDSTIETMLPFEVLISHICQHWRAVALRTPSLWTKINVSPFESVFFERTKILLERSKSLPIDIGVDCRGQPPDDYEKGSFRNLDVLMSLLVPHISRWRSIEVAVSRYKYMFIFLSAVSDPSIGGAPQLEALKLYDCIYEESLTTFAHRDLVQHFKLFGGVAPRLKTVVLWGVHVDWCQGWLSYGSNISDLALCFHAEDVRPSWSQLVGILTPKLKTLSLRCSGPLGSPHDWCSEGGSGSYNSGVIELRSLIELTLTFRLPGYVSGLLRCLALPALQNLTLDFLGRDYTDVVAQIVNPATIAVPMVPEKDRQSLLSGLETLKLRRLLCSDHSVELMYAELGNLKALKLSMADLTPAFLQLLDPLYSVPGHPVWLPSLTSLTTSDVPGDQILQLVRNRKEAGVPLKAVYMREDDDVTDADILRFEETLETFNFFEGSYYEDSDSDDESSHSDDGGSDDELELLPDIEEQHDTVNDSITANDFEEGRNTVNNPIASDDFKGRRNTVNDSIIYDDVNELIGLALTQHPYERMRLICHRFWVKMLLAWCTLAARQDSSSKGNG